jgi:hypothetical protein
LVVVVRCGAGGHRFAPRVGEIHLHGGLIMLAYGPDRGVSVAPAIGPFQGQIPEDEPRSVRFPCRGRLEGGGRCKADWNVETPRLQAAYRRAVAERRHELVLGVDL